MKQKTRILLIAYGAAMLLVFNAALWACHVGANGYRTRLDVHANRAFGEAFQAVERLDLSLKKLNFASDAAMENAVCAEIFSDAQRVETALSILPVELDALEQISRHVSVLGDYAFTLSRTAAAGQRIPEDVKTILSDLSETTASLYDTLGALRQELNDGAVVPEHYDRLTDALDDLDHETVKAADSLDAEFHAIAERFQTVPALSYDGKYTDHTGEIASCLEGKPEVSEPQALEAAAAFLECDQDALESLGRAEGDIPCWRFQLVGDGETTIAVTVQGGEVLRVLSSAQTATTDDPDAALRFLNNQGFENMQQLTDGQTYVPVLNDVYLLPDAVFLQLAEDGSVLRYDASEYLKHHRERDLSAFENASDTSFAISDGVSINNTRKVLLLSPGGQERPCLELTCSNPDGLVCVVDWNLQTGLQERLTLDGESNY